MKLNHKNVSFAKSGLRILAGVSLVLSSVIVAGLFLIVAEFENHDEAKQYAKDRRKHLTPGEKQYYKYSFIVKKVS